MASYGRTFVAKKARAVFPDRDVEDILRALDAYGRKVHEPERERVQLAILKLCDEQNLPGPDCYVDAAKQDYRDVLAWAEYPNQMKIDPGSPLNREEKDRIAKLDRAQYETWLRKEG